MKSLTEIEAAITQLSEIETRQLADWLQTYLEDAWDKQIEADAKFGRLDKLIQLAEADITANRVKPLNEVLDNC
ncbi:hypothetical protein [Anabaena sp. UHCC 0451]|uniref:hypothetical protein n=1 Tax=Anabaena sp. UHCC 0451 TaxID=2055235 RepID=UPI002B215FEE|nr:hypothetical protein [Anabaena sp. UHCC 0451]MEA5577180.1 hypothetical protein [Anabaena sp. UHCC 0451]